MSKRLWTLPLVAALLVAAGSMAYAIPSLGGPTGIVSLPNANIATTTNLETALTYQAFSTFDMYSPGDAAAAALDMYAPNDATSWTLHALRGTSEEAELWGAYSRVHDGADGDVRQIGGKFQVKGDWPGDVKVAVGGSLGRWVNAFGLPALAAVDMYDAGPAVTDAVTDVDFKKAYIVATREVTPIARGWRRGPRTVTQMIGSVGLMYISIDPEAGNAETLMQPFGALEIIKGDTTLCVEYRSKDNDMDLKGVFSAVLRRPAGEGVTVEIGTTNASPIGLGLEDQDIFVRLGYDVPVTTGYY